MRAKKQSYIGRIFAHLNIKYYALVRSVLMVIFLIILGYIFNITGWKEVNFILLLVFFLSSVLFLLKPNIIVSLLFVGVAFDAINESKSTLIGIEYLKKIISSILLWGSFVFFILATKSFEHVPGIFFGIMAGVVVLLLLSVNTGIGVAIRKRFILVYTTAMMIGFSIVMIPGPYWMKTLGFDPLTSLDLAH